MKFEKTLITPDMAKAILDSQGAAPGYTDKVHKIRQDMENGSYKLTGQPIVIDKNGFLVDGPKAC